MPAPVVAEIVTFGGRTGGGHAAAGGLPGGALPPLHGQRRGPGGQGTESGPPRRCTPRWSTWWPTASPAPWGRSGCSSAVPTSSSRTNTASSPPENRPGSTRCRPTAPTCTWPSPAELAAVICIADPLREEAADVITALRRLGIRKIVMLTGDSERTAAAIAAQVGVDEYRAEVLPEDKAAFVEAERGQGPHRHHAGRRHQRFPGPVRRQRGHRHQRRRRHRPGDRRRHHRRGRSATSW